MEDGLSALSMHVGMAVERLREQQRDLDDLKMWRRSTEDRLKAMEVKPSIKGFLLELYTPKQWGMIVLVSVAALWGIVTPQEARDKVRSLLSLGPSNLSAPR